MRDPRGLVKRGEFSDIAGIVCFAQLSGERSMFLKRIHDRNKRPKRTVLVH